MPIMRSFSQHFTEPIAEILSASPCTKHIGDADKISAMGSVKCWAKLRMMGVQCDLHTLATRGHCFQIKSAPDTGSWSWLDQVWDFLTRKGLNK